MTKTNAEVRPVHVTIDEFHEELLEGLCTRPGQPRISRAEAMRWCLRETAKREGIAPAEEPAA